VSTFKAWLRFSLLLHFGLVLPAMADEWARWQPVDPGELAAKEPKVDKDADAEALLWEVRVEDQWDGYKLNNILLHKIRIKIFNDRGREAHSKVDLTYLDKTRISDIAGRTVKTDGSIVELTKDGIFDRELIKASGVKVRARSFVLPNVSAGDIIEYRWRETRSQRHAEGARTQRLDDSARRRSTALRQREGVGRRSRGQRRLQRVPGSDRRCQCRC
jgi:hypothetical protein